MPLGGYRGSPAGRSARHRALNDLVARCFASAGTPVTKEPSGLFRAQTDRGPMNGYHMPNIKMADNNRKLAYLRFEQIGISSEKK